MNAPVMSDALQRVTQLVQLLDEQAARVAAAESALADAKAAHRRTERGDLPDLMSELGIDSITLDTGTTVSVKEDVSAQISEPRRAEAHAWLRERGFGGLIKTRVVVEYDRGSEGEAIALGRRLEQELDRDVTVAETIAPQTLAAFVRERLAAGEAVPFELFGVHPFSVAKVRRAAPRR